MNIDNEQDSKINVYSKDDAKTIIGERIKSIVKEKRYTYKDVAEGSGISYSYVSEVANGKYLPSAETIIKLAVFLDIDIQELVDRLEYWIRPKGIEFNSEYITDEERSLYYNFMKDEKELLVHSMKIDVNFKGKADNTSSDDGVVYTYSTGWDYKKAKNYITFTRHEIEDNSLDLIGIPKNSVLSTIPVENYDNIVNGDIYRIQVENRTYFRKVFKVEDVLVLIPYSTDSRFNIISVTKDQIDTIEKASMVSFSIKSIL